MNKKTLFKSFLNFFWLRPENALIFSLKADKLNFYKKYFKGNSIDISCGNGIFTFLTFGGRISEKNDMYQSLDYGNKDIYDKYENYNIKIDYSPKKKFLYGSDWKKNLLKKSKKLKFYKKLILHDNNFKFPFKFILSSNKPRRNKNFIDNKKIILLSLKFSKISDLKFEIIIRKIILT